MTTENERLTPEHIGVAEECLETLRFLVRPCYIKAMRTEEKGSPRYEKLLQSCRNLHRGYVQILFDPKTSIEDIKAMDAHAAQVFKTYNETGYLPDEYTLLPTRATA